MSAGGVARSVSTRGRRHSSAVPTRVWGSRGKGAALPLASGALDDERSDVGQGACLRSSVPTPQIAQQMKGVLT